MFITGAKAKRYADFSGYGQHAPSLATSSATSFSGYIRSSLACLGLLRDRMATNMEDTAEARRTVQKEGNDKGRDFYMCARPRDEQCNYFQWADEMQDSGQCHN